MASCYYSQISYQIMTVLRFTVARNSKRLIAVDIMANKSFFFATLFGNYILYQHPEVFHNKLIINCKGFRLITWLYWISNLRYAYKTSRAMMNMHWNVLSLYLRTVLHDALFLRSHIARSNTWVKKQCSARQLVNKRME